MKSLASAVVSSILLVAASPVAAQSPLDQPLLLGAGMCGPLENPYGPYDYRKDQNKLEIVERFHFSPRVEALRGKHGEMGRVGGDLDYTLRAFPNHPRALYALTRYVELMGRTRLGGNTYPIECYFDRAIRFAPDDAQVRALYADFLVRQKRGDDAREQLEVAGRLPLTPQIAYNLALAWSGLGEHEKALPLARQAYEGGVQFPGLREQLQRAGVWK